MELEVCYHMLLFPFIWFWCPLLRKHKIEQRCRTSSTVSQTPFLFSAHRKGRWAASTLITPIARALHCAQSWERAGTNTQLGTASTAPLCSQHSTAQHSTGDAEQHQGQSVPRCSPVWMGAVVHLCTGECTDSSLCLLASLTIVEIRHSEKDGSLKDQVLSCVCRSCLLWPSADQLIWTFTKTKVQPGCFSWCWCGHFLTWFRQELAHFPWQPSCRSRDTLPSCRRSWRHLEAGQCWHRKPAAKIQNKTKPTPQPSQPPLHKYFAFLRRLPAVFRDVFQMLSWVLGWQPVNRESPPGPGRLLPALPQHPQIPSSLFDSVTSWTNPLLHLPLGFPLSLQPSHLCPLVHGKDSIPGYKPQAAAPRTHPELPGASIHPLHLLQASSTAETQQCEIPARPESREHRQHLCCLSQLNMCLRGFTEWMLHDVKWWWFQALQETPATCHITLKSPHISTCIIYLSPMWFFKKNIYL